VTSAIQTKIKQDIEKEIPKLRNRLMTNKTSAIQIEFSLDTFRAERFLKKWIDQDYSDAGMREGIYATANLYDSLLNKYYKKLLTVLKGNDKQNLLQAQKAWLSFRDAELKLVGVISKDQYSGGGTIQQLTGSSCFFNLIKDRTIAIFNHYSRATQSD
jgi:uncharacterized protein YecT (DUF1311 family)